MQLSSYRSIVKRKGVPARIFAWNLSLPLQRLPKVIGCGKFNANTGTGWGGGALPTKVRSRGSAVRLPPGYSHRFNRPGTLRGPPCFSRLSPGRHLALLEEEGARLRISHVSFFFFFEGGLTGVGPSPQEG